MRLVCFKNQGKTHYGAMKGDKVVDLSIRLGTQYPDIVAFIAGGETAKQAAAKLIDKEAGDYSYDAVELLPVVPNPGKIICIGLNYKGHIDEANRLHNRSDQVSQYPMVFARWPESLAAHRQPILRPKVSTELDYEAELLVVMGKNTGRYVPPEKALDYVYGYSCMNEACMRDYLKHSRQINPGKNFEQTGSTGPWMVTADEIPDPHNLEIEMRLNGELMQKANTKDMVHPIDKIIAYVTQWMPLKAGDLIASGTMSGVGSARVPQVWMKPGDVAEIKIEKIGTLHNAIEDERH